MVVVVTEIISSSSSPGRIPPKSKNSSSTREDTADGVTGRGDSDTISVVVVVAAARQSSVLPSSGIAVSSHGSRDLLLSLSAEKGDKRKIINYTITFVHKVAMFIDIEMSFTYLFRRIHPTEEPQPAGEVDDGRVGVARVGDGGMAIGVDGAAVVVVVVLSWTCSTSSCWAIGTLCSSSSKPLAIAIARRPAR